MPQKTSAATKESASSVNCSAIVMLVLKTSTGGEAPAVSSIVFVG